MEPEVRAAAGGSILVNYALGQRILRLRSGSRRAAQRWLVAGIVLNLALLGWFKYADFLIARPSSPAAHTRAGHLPAAGDQLLHLPADHVPGRSSRSADRVDAGLLPYAAFVTFFPHLIAGPIVRPREIMPQLLAPDLATPRADQSADGLHDLPARVWRRSWCWRTCSARFADVGFDAAAHGRTADVLRGLVRRAAYALQIYFDFSGYSDMAIGLARMLNMRFPLNFDSPYQATNIAEFWRRWHITLGRFLRDYVYIPLGGNRHGEVAAQSST